MYSMKETCEKLNITYETLKYYCNEGLIPNVKRDENNYRVFDDNNIGWIKSLLCLKKCGMSIKDIKKYLNLCLEGKSTIPERKLILEKQKENLLAQIASLNDSINFIDYKQQLYDDMLSGKLEYFSYLLPTSSYKNKEVK